VCGRLGQPARLGRGEAAAAMVRRERGRTERGVARACVRVFCTIFHFVELTGAFQAAKFMGLWMGVSCYAWLDGRDIRTDRV
jgi:hypothetical protein